MEFTSGSNDHVDESRQWLEEGEVEFASGTNDRTAATTTRPSDRAREASPRADMRVEDKINMWMQVTDASFVSMVSHIWQETSGIIHRVGG